LAGAFRLSIGEVDIFDRTRSSIQPAGTAANGVEKTCSWRQCLTVFTEELSRLRGRDIELVMGEALCNWVGWRLPG
jgi:hypothetical protein